MVNATEMAKPFGKLSKDWLRLKSTDDFLETLSVARKISLPDLVQVKNGGTGFGTWMHEDLALEFARWLSPAFAIWCNYIKINTPHRGVYLACTEKIQLTGCSESFNEF